MKMNWYYRMMLSYTPIFFVVISSIIFVFFMVLNHASENRYIETNRVTLERMVHNTDANLKLIERNVVSKLLMDTTLQEFYSNPEMKAFDYFETQKKLIDLKSSFPFSSSIYIYNEAKQRVLSESGAYTLSSFGDIEFLLTQYKKAVPTEWTEPRSYVHLAHDENKQKVVSLVKYYYEDRCYRCECLRKFDSCLFK
jgi:two-component system response regulator YesN